MIMSAVSILKVPLSYAHTVKVPSALCTHMAAVASIHPRSRKHDFGLCEAWRSAVACALEGLFLFRVVAHLFW